MVDPLGTAMFWDLRHPVQSVAVVDTLSAREVSYGELHGDVERAAAAMNSARDGKVVCLLLAQNRYECLVGYLAALRARKALILADASLNAELLARVIGTYQPDLVCAASAEVPIAHYRKLPCDRPGLWLRQAPTILSAPHPDLALLLNTSGSTGSPKLVRLTYDNLQANAQSIVQALTLRSCDRAVTSLPMAYAYGLSVINSHLLIGATLLMTEFGILQRDFWDSIDRHGCTSFSGVPYTYQVLLQTGLLSKRCRGLHTLTQAGGRLADAAIEQLYRIAVEAKSRLFVMYGQTEATARISYVPFDALDCKIGSIGIAIPGGSMQLSTSGELVYTGPNVMMGYAECREDLSRGDDLHGCLHTGDLARRDQDGFFYITGRMKRFLKLFGKRFNLDEVELILQRNLGFPIACFGHDDLLVVAIESQDSAAVATAARRLFGLPNDVVQILPVESLPRTINGKVNYRGLEQVAHA
jgi:long-chain acyl-CoA synthetase